MLTQTSKEIIQELERLNIPLTPEAKTIIIDKVYTALTLTYDEARNSNGCDCGQPSCSYCN